MSDMPGPGATLREIHRLRRNVKDLDSRIEAGPRQLKMQHAAIARHEENLKTAQEELKKKIPEREKALAQAKAQAAQFEHDHDSRMADLAQQRQQVLTQLAEIEATLPAEIRSTYDRLISFKGEDAMAAARDGNCVAC